MGNHFTKLVKDLDNENLPKNLNNVDKIKCDLVSGKRVYWYFKEDLDFFTEEGEDIKRYSEGLYSGIVVGRHDVENRFGQIDFSDVVIVMDTYPIEMDYPQFTWIALKRLLDDDNLIEIYSDNNFDFPEKHQNED